MFIPQVGIPGPKIKSTLPPAGTTIPLCPGAQGNPGSLECRSHLGDPAHPVQETRVLSGES